MHRCMIHVGLNVRLEFKEREGWIKKGLDVFLN